MTFLWALLFVNAGEWIMYPQVKDKWAFLLGSKYLMLALVATALLNYCKSERLSVRSLIALFAISTWVDFIKFVIWNYRGQDVDMSLPLFILFVIWFLHVLLRQYNFPGSKPKAETISILVHKPKGALDLIKSLLFFPSDSICVYAARNVYSFRRSKGHFVFFGYEDSLLETHNIIDTGIPCTPFIVLELSKVLGQSRFPYCKCVWAIRHVLKEVGGKYAIQHWWEYFPPLYLSRILRK